MPPFSRHSRAGGNPVVLSKMPFGFVSALRGFFDWLDSRLRGNDGVREY